MIISLKSEEEEKELTSWALGISNLINYSLIKIWFSNVVLISVNALIDVQTIINIKFLNTSKIRIRYYIVSRIHPAVEMR
jgi:hypothetical protein